MSKLGLIDPLTKQRRVMRAALLRNPPRFRTAASHFKAAIILAELALIHNSSRLNGAMKHELFSRGAKQLGELPP
jgi:hypothetical protein